MKDYLVLQNKYLIYVHIIISEKYNPLSEVIEANNEFICICDYSDIYAIMLS